jgi:hypothetical protein
MVTVEVDAVRVEKRLLEGGIECPCCGGVLGGWGWARERPILGLTGRVRPRRGRCRGCGVTHVLLPVVLLLRRAYSAEIVWAVFLARVAGAGHRTITLVLGVLVPAGTVRRWLRRMASRLEEVRVWFLGVGLEVGVEVRPPEGSGSVWGDALGAVGFVAAAIATRFGAVGLEAGSAVVRVAVSGSGGRLLSPGWPPR